MGAFRLALIRDKIRIHPSDLAKPFQEAIIDEINAKYANKIVEQLGLCVRVWDVTRIEQPYLQPGEGSCYVPVAFHMIVFRPFIGQVLTGRVRRCDEQGIHVSMEFFDDILIPSSGFKENTVFDKEEQLWVWQYDGNELFYDLDEPIRFRVEAETFTDVHPVYKETLKKLAKDVPQGVSGASPGGPGRDGGAQGGAAGVAAAMSGTEGAATVEEVAANAVPYALICSISEDGLGLVSWW